MSLGGGVVGSAAKGGPAGKGEGGKDQHSDRAVAGLDKEVASILRGGPLRVSVASTLPGLLPA